LKIFPLACGIGLSSQANASLVTLQSLDINRSFDYSDGFKTYWNANATGLNAPDVFEVDAFENIRSGGDNFNLLTIEFDLKSTSLFNVFAGLDAHYGAEIYINDALEYKDLWWSNNWSHKSVVELENTVLSAGKNVVNLFWAESCCNGPNTVRFSFNNAEPVYLSSSSLVSAITAAPIANSIALVGLGLMGLIGLGNRRKAKPLRKA
jgi:hypothetical protein